jgi:hypothetical protein
MWSSLSSLSDGNCFLTQESKYYVMPELFARKELRAEMSLLVMIVLIDPHQHITQQKK